MFDPFYIVVGLVFLTMITLLVAAHELGHYLFARLFGMGVEEFAIGFGKKPLLTWMKKTYVVNDDTDALPSSEGDTGLVPGGPKTETTVFNIRPWPVGGFVRIKGMVPEEDGSETKIPGGFYSKPAWQRWVVLFAGPVFSILAGWLVLVPLFMVDGVPRPDERPIIGGIAQGKPADKAGLKPADKVVSIDGAPVTRFFDVITKVQQSEGKPMTFVVDRKGEQITASVTPILDPEPTPVFAPDMQLTDVKKRQWKLGMGPTEAKKQLPFAEALTTAMMLPVKMVGNLAGIFVKPSRFQEEVGGPISMVALTAESTKQGLPYVIFLAGALSLSLGIFNLLPVTPLDGGQMIVAFVEMLRGGRRLSFKVQNAVAGVGLTLVLMLFVSVLVVDVKRFFPFGGDDKPAATQTK